MELEPLIHWSNTLFNPSPFILIIDHDQLYYNIYFIIVLIIRLEVYGSAWDKDISKCDFITLYL